MNSKEYAKIVEAYQKIYEQQIGVPLKEPTDRAAKKQLEKMIPKGEKVHTFQSSLQKANYELDGQQLDEINTSITTQNDRIPDFETEKKAKQVPGLRVNKPSSPVEEEVETDLFDYLLEYLVAEGYADTNKAALAIMANMSEEWKQSIVEEVFDEALTGERYKKAVKKPGGTAYSRMVSADPSKRATRGGRGGESDFGAGDRGSGNKAARRAGTYKED